MNLNNIIVMIWLLIVYANSKQHRKVSVRIFSCNFSQTVNNTQKFLYGFFLVTYRHQFCTKPFFTVVYAYFFLKT